MGNTGRTQDDKRGKTRRSDRALQSMAADQRYITPWSPWLIWERLLSTQLSPSLLLRLAPVGAVFRWVLQSLRDSRAQRLSSSQVSLDLLPRVCSVLNDKVRYSAHFTLWVHIKLKKGAGRKEEYDISCKQFLQDYSYSKYFLHVFCFLRSINNNVKQFICNGNMWPAHTGIRVTVRPTTLLLVKTPDSYRPVPKMLV